MKMTYQLFRLRRKYVELAKKNGYSKLYQGKSDLRDGWYGHICSCHPNRKPMFFRVEDGEAYTVVFNDLEA